MNSHACLTKTRRKNYFFPNIFFILAVPFQDAMQYYRYRKSRILFFSFVYFNCWSISLLSFAVVWFALQSKLNVVVEMDKKNYILSEVFDFVIDVTWVCTKNVWNHIINKSQHTICMLFYAFINSLRQNKYLRFAYKTWFHWSLFLGNFQILTQLTATDNFGCDPNSRPIKIFSNF